MKTTEKVFVNPLCALAFIEGISFAGNLNLTCKPPRKEGSARWVVVVEDDEKNQVKTIANKDGSQPQQIIMGASKNNAEQKLPCGRCLGCIHNKPCSFNVAL